VADLVEVEQGDGLDILAANRDVHASRLPPLGGAEPHPLEQLGKVHLLMGLALPEDVS
jgi:hypothetical protein